MFASSLLGVYQVTWPDFEFYADWLFDSAISTFAYPRYYGEPHYTTTSSRIVAVVHQQEISSSEGKSPVQQPRRRWRGPSPCDATVLAQCSSLPEQNNNIFVDVDEASIAQFYQLNNDGTYQMLLYYNPIFSHLLFQPHIDDATTASVVEGNATATAATSTLTAASWLKAENVTKIGRVNCAIHTNLCEDVDLSRGPEFRLFGENRKYNYVWTTGEDPSIVAGPYHHVLEEDWSRFESRLETAYERDSTDCLWRRYGLDGGLNPECQRFLGHYLREEELFEESSSGEIQQIKNLIGEGERLSVAIDAVVCFLGLLLFVMLTCAGWRLLKRCCTRVCGISTIVRSSANLTVEERRQQTDAQVRFFLAAGTGVSICNIFFPYLVLFIAAPLSVIAVIWLWVVELRCYPFGGGKRPDRKTSNTATNRVASTESSATTPLLDA